MQCNAREDDDKKVYEILTPSFQKSTALLISLEEILECWCCWWQSGEEWWRGDVNVQRFKAKGLVWAPQRLLNVEFDWEPDHLSNEPPVESPSIPITFDMVKKVISQMKADIAPGPSGIVVEMILAAGDTGASTIWLTWQLLSFPMARYPLTASRVSLSASTRVRGMHWKGETVAVSSWQSRLWKSWRGLWTASSDIWCQSTVTSLASSKAEAQQTQSLLSGSCKRSI